MTPARESDEATRIQLIESCQGLVRNIAWTIHQRMRAHVDLDDLIAYGQIGLAEAAQRFDADQGTRFTTYAYYRIRGSIFDGLSQMGWFRRSDFHAGRYERLAQELLGDAYGEEDDDLEREARWLSDVSVRLSVVYLASGLAGEDAAADVEDVETPPPPAELVLRELRGAVRAAIAVLPEQARRLIQAVYFEGCSLKDAGAQLGVSKSWASRLHDRTLRQLAVALRRSGQIEQPA